MDIDKNLELIISNNLWPQLIIKSQHNSLVDVYLNQDDKTYSNLFRHKFIIKLSDSMSTVKPLIVLFPNHPDERKRILYTKNYSKYHKLSKEINTRLQHSLNGETVKIAIVYRDKIYRIRGLYGTAYLLWSERINCETINQKQNQIAESIPVFFELNGQMDIRGVVPFMDDFLVNEYGKQKLYPIVTKSTTILIPTDVVLFSCEVDSRKDNQRKINTISNNEANMITKDPAVRRIMQGLRGEPVPFVSRQSLEDSIIVGSSDFESEGTPRDDDSEFSEQLVTYRPEGIVLELEQATPRVLLPSQKEEEIEVYVPLIVEKEEEEKEIE